MTRRDAIIAVLKKWAGKPHYETLSYCYPKDGLVDDLLTCFPEPDREALERLYNDYKDRGRPQFLDAVMRWAAGETEPPVWCEHIRYIQCKDGSGGWTADMCDSTLYEHDLEAWDICPVAGCHAPRPASGGG